MYSPGGSGPSCTPLRPIQPLDVADAFEFPLVLWRSPGQDANRLGPRMLPLSPRSPRWMQRIGSRRVLCREDRGAKEDREKERRAHEQSLLQVLKSSHPRMDCTWTEQLTTVARSVVRSGRPVPENDAPTLVRSIDSRRMPV